MVNCFLLCLSKSSQPSQKVMNQTISMGPIVLSASQKTWCWKLNRSQHFRSHHTSPDRAKDLPHPSDVGTTHPSEIEPIFHNMPQRRMLIQEKYKFHNVNFGIRISKAHLKPCYRREFFFDNQNGWIPSFRSCCSFEFSLHIHLFKKVKKVFMQYYY